MSVSDSSTGRTAEAARTLVTAATAFVSLTDGQLVVYPRAVRAIALAATRLERAEQALRYARRGLALAIPTITPGLLGLEAQGLLMQGRVTEAAAVAETATDSAVLAGNEQLLLWTLQTAATAAMWAGELDRAVFSAREAVALPPASARASSSRSPGSSWPACCCPPATRRARARSSTRSAASPPKRCSTSAPAAAGSCSSAPTSSSETCTPPTSSPPASRLAPPPPSSTSCAPPPSSPAPRSCSPATSRAPPDTAASEAVSRATRGGNQLLAARARGVCGRAAAATGDRDRALSELEHARLLLMDCGAHREADAVARELRRLGRRIRRAVVVQASPDEGLRLLSTREREVAEHVAAGETNRGIAGALFLSEKTIESHLARIYGKLGVRSRVALAALVRERARDV